MVTRPQTTAAIAAIAWTLAVGAAAQISPGKLSRSHAALEGSGQCLKCHDAQHGVSAEKCFTCHTALKARVAAGRGLHAQPDQRDCKLCHVEHQGTDYDLVWWGKAGQQAFDHKRTGQPLVGRHATLPCADCHSTLHQKDLAALRSQGVNPQRTFLGLPTACQACHRDAHRGQFAPRSCSDCHNANAWRPAPGFNHDRTAFRLTGRHAVVACDRCHRVLETDAQGTFRRFRGAKMSAKCADCHEDPHRGRLGSACEKCHDSKGWRQVQTTGFDHDRTAYPLRGRHAALACEKCHAPGKPLRIAHQSCTDCHADAHHGQLASRIDRGRCETCHDVSGFLPARFSVEDHQKTAYPLGGAHAAVACRACHRQVPVESLRTPGRAAGGGGRLTVRLRISTQRCADCHRDPHQGEVDKWTRAGGCETCHRVSAWRDVAFDHAQTAYPLVGAHTRVACIGCHKKTAAGAARERVRFAGLSQACAACHTDPHRGQFVSGGTTACDRCHTQQDLKPARFDHSRDARWPLKGAHARAACAACHKPVTEDGATFVRYKPLPADCRSCHSHPGGATRPAN